MCPHEDLGDALWQEHHRSDMSMSMHPIGHVLLNIGHIPFGQLKWGLPGFSTAKLISTLCFFIDE